MIRNIEIELVGYDQDQERIFKEASQSHYHRNSEAAQEMLERRWREGAPRPHAQGSGFYAAHRFPIYQAVWNGPAYKAVGLRIKDMRSLNWELVGSKVIGSPWSLRVVGQDVKRLRYIVARADGFHFITWAAMRAKRKTEDWWWASVMDFLVRNERVSNWLEKRADKKKQEQKQKRPTSLSMWGTMDVLEVEEEQVRRQIMHIDPETVAKNLNVPTIDLSDDK